DWLDWIPRDVVYSEEESGDTINDAVFKRNTYLEDKYNFKIEQAFTENFGGDIKKAIQGGDELYDMIESPMRDAPAFAQNGYFLSLYDVPNLDLDQPWWDQAANKSLSLGKKLYFTSGDILMVNNDTCTGFVFNKELLKELQLEDPYPIVKAGKWTMDKLYDLCKDASSDLDGNGEINYQNDRFGLIGQRDTLISFLHSANEYICKKDDADYPYITFGGERSYAAMEACYKVMYDMNITHNAHHLEGKVPGIYPVSEEIFMSNRALFMWVRLRIVENLRSMDKDFGILPLPKLDENQDDYYTDVISYTGCLVCVPANASNPERTGHILEAICAESKYTTMPAYYDVTLKTKMARDEDSSDMLDIIFKNRIWDIGEIYNFGAFGGDLIYMSMKNDSALASKFEKSEPKMQKDIDKAIEKYESLD
ncbi:MAG: extracellular solute-binding protein, partial [Oscillospiraceae bacterium]|nr:extracellular solute-binding protein [Oscillospiraceae bacterium]